MSKIVNTTRGRVRPARDPREAVDARDISIGENTQPGSAREARPLGPVTPRRDLDDRGLNNGGLTDRGLADQEVGDGGGGTKPKHAPPLQPLPGPRGLVSDFVVERSAAVSAQSLVSRMAVEQLIGALEQHGRRAAMSHSAALGVLRRLQALVEQVTERRSWPRVPRVRKRAQRRRREA